MRVAVVALLWLLATAAHASSASAVSIYCGAQIPDNHTNSVTPANVRNCINQIISNTGTLADTISVSTVSATTYTGYALGLLVSPTWATQALSLGTIDYNNYVDVRQMGVICDGNAHSDNLADAQAALNLASIRPGITVNLAPKGQTCVYGTNTTLNVEQPLKYLSNTTVLFQGTALHNINNGDLFLLEGYYDDAGATADQRQYNVAIIGEPNNLVDVVSRTTSQNRKMIGVTNVTRGLMRGVYVSTSTINGSFGIQLRNTDDVVIEGNTSKIFHNPSGAAGGDAFHIVGSATQTLVRNNSFWGDDDGCSITQEGSVVANKVADGVVFSNNECGSYGYSGGKMFTDGNATGAYIQNTLWIGNHFFVWGPYGNGGNTFDIYTDNDGGIIDNTTFVGNVFDCTNTTRNTGSGAGSCLLMQSDVQNVLNTSFYNNLFTGYQYRGVQTSANVNGVTFDGNIMANYLGTSEIVSVSLVTAMQRSSNNFMQVTFDPSVSLAGISANAAYYVSVTAGANVSNTGRFYITTVSDTGHYVLAAANNISSSTDQTGASISASIVFRPGSFFYTKGAYNVVIKNNRFDDPPAAAIMENDTNGHPQNVVFQNNIVTNFWDWAAFQITAGYQTMFLGNTCMNSHGNACIRETGNTNVSNSIFIMNNDIGVNSQSRQSFILSDTDHMYEWGNIGNNGDGFDQYPFGTVSATLVSATTVQPTLLKPVYSAVTPSTAVAGTIGWNTNGAMCIVSGSAYVKVGTSNVCNFSPAN